jgi:hypothetical protein
MAPTTAVDAEYRTLAEFNNVTFHFPSQESDKFLKKIQAHQINLPDGQIIPIAEHFRRGYLAGGQIITGNIFLDQKYQGSKVLVDISVVMKIDHFRGKSCLILDIKPASANNASADYILNIDVTDSRTDSNRFAFSVPETNKYIQFLKTKN